MDRISRRSALVACASLPLAGLARGDDGRSATRPARPDPQALDWPAPGEVGIRLYLPGSRMPQDHDFEGVAEVLNRSDLTLQVQLHSKRVVDLDMGAAGVAEAMASVPRKVGCSLRCTFCYDDEAWMPGFFVHGLARAWTVECAPGSTLLKFPVLSAGFRRGRGVFRAWLITGDIPQLSPNAALSPDILAASQTFSLELT